MDSQVAICILTDHTWHIYEQLLTVQKLTNRTVMDSQVAICILTDHT